MCHLLPVPFQRHPLWWLAPPPLPRWEACHWILSRPRAPYESSSLATQLRWGALWVLGISGSRCLWQQRQKNQTTGLRPWEMHPFWCLRHHFPRRGKFALRSASSFISISRCSVTKISPTGGDAVGRRGVFPSGRRPGLPVFPPVRAVVKVLSKWRRRRPLPPSEPSEPSRPKGVSKKAPTKAAAGSFL